MFKNDGVKKQELDRLNINLEVKKLWLIKE